jgi:hypothetical protein
MYGVELINGLGFDYGLFYGASALGSVRELNIHPDKYLVR